MYYGYFLKMKQEVLHACTFANTEIGALRHLKIIMVITCMFLYILNIYNAIFFLHYYFLILTQPYFSTSKCNYFKFLPFYKIKQHVQRVLSSKMYTQKIFFQVKYLVISGSFV